MASASTPAPSVVVRPMTADDVEDAARICHASFNAFNASVGMSPEFPPREQVDVCHIMLSKFAEEDFEGFVAVDGSGAVVGSNLVMLRDEVASIGPISVAQGRQNAGVARLLMKAVMDAAERRGLSRVRLTQVASNTKSFSLYLSLGFDPCYSLCVYEGHCSAEAEAEVAAELGVSHLECRELREGDVEACSSLHHDVCGVHRRRDIAAALSAPDPVAVVLGEGGAIVAYSAGCQPTGHSVARTETAFRALIVFQSQRIRAAQAAGAPLPPATLKVPQGRPKLMRWLAGGGFRLLCQNALMSYGEHALPAAEAVYCPSVYY